MSEASSAAFLTKSLSATDISPTASSLFLLAVNPQTSLPLRRKYLIFLTAEIPSFIPFPPADETKDITLTEFKILTVLSVSCAVSIPLSRTAETFFFLAALTIPLNSRFSLSVALNFTAETPTGT